ncbi:hypothetical protein [Crossiella sp. S99.1]|uniref:hypothetical protein n=1 Tax=Crossiella sp. S99.1 TaxID=2936271 RepID=UPI00200000A7|nr:hypothetical protein [Crossiella sp. S99.1]MCK2257048.1 hypothetical protein [Crossiella sp. S99.1]
MPITRDELGLDLTVSIYEDTGIQIEPWDDNNLLVIFGGPVQRIVVVLDRDDFERLYHLMTPVVGHYDPVPEPVGDLA